MATKQQHIIQRQILDVDLPVAEAEAKRWQERLSHFANDVLPARLELLLDSITPNGELLRLDSLEIEVSLELDEGHWE
ncbi:MAG: hypothetical protein IT258_18375, partial [Saprospiraceae bacterium]|nr:hypothetical protein [Saprospiraceae bacterium]